MRLLRQSPSIIYLNHEAATIRLDRGKDSETTFRVFGSPLSPARGRWAFGYSDDEALSHWNQIPLESDVVVTHTPPKYHCDESKDRGAAGCELLRQALWRVRPRLLICGHVHEGRGVERVRWDLVAPHIKYKEERTITWTESSQGTKHASLDLSSKGPHPLDNDGGTGQYATENVDKSGCPVRSEDLVPRAEISSNIQPKSTPDVAEQCQVPISDDARVASIICSTSDRATGTTPLGANDGESTQPPEIASATRGQGGMPLSGRCDMEALWERLGRRETCVINAAIMASSWPHKGINGKKYHKPIVVDIDLPIARSR